MNTVFATIIIQVPKKGEEKTNVSIVLTATYLYRCKKNNLSGLFFVGTCPLHFCYQKEHISHVLNNLVQSGSNIRAIIYCGAITNENSKHIIAATE